MARNLTRNTKVYVSNRASVLDGGGLVDITLVSKDNTWEIKVLDGYSFSQATTTEDITISEAGDAPIRGQKTYNTAQDPVDISIATYVRPYKANALVDAPEKILWASLTSKTIGTDGTNGTMVSNVAGNGEGVFQAANTMLVDFEESDTNELGKLVVWFVLENSTYMVDNVNLTTAEIDFAIDGIAQISWSGMGTSVTELSTTNHAVVLAWASGTDFTGAPATTSDSFLRNKLSTMKLQNNEKEATAVDTVIATAANQTSVTEGTATFVTDGLFQVGDYLHNATLNETRVISNITETVITIDKAWTGTAAVAAAFDTYEIYDVADKAKQEYTIAITGGSLTIENSMDFLTPEELGVVNQPLPGFAGSRAVTGSITAYLDTGSYGTAALLQDAVDDIASVSNSYSFTLYMGGTAVTPKRLEISLGTAQLSVPTINTDSVIATEITFAGQGSGDLIENQDEVKLTYYSA